MAAALVQSATGVFSGTVTGTVTFASAITAGNAIGLYVAFTGATNVISTIAMTGETFTKIDAGPTTHGTGAGTGSAQWAYALNTAGGQTVVTVTLDGAQFGIVLAREISGIATASAADQSIIVGQTAPGANVTDAVTSGSVTPGQDNEYLFGATCEFTFVGATITQGTGWTSRETVNDNGVGGRGEEIVQTSAAAQAATFTQDNAAGGYLTGILTLKAASSAATLWAQSVM